MEHNFPTGDIENFTIKTSDHFLFFSKSAEGHNEILDFIEMEIYILIRQVPTIFFSNFVIRIMFFSNLEIH